MSLRAIYCCSALYQLSLTTPGGGGMHWRSLFQLLVENSPEYHPVASVQFATKGTFCCLLLIPHRFYVHGLQYIIILDRSLM